MKQAQQMPGINLEVLNRVREDKINEKLAYSWGNWAINPHIIGEVLTEDNEDFHFIYFESVADNSTKGMKRYHFYVYSLLYIELYYSDSNVIGDQFTYTMQENKQKFNNYLKGLQNTLQQYL